MKTSTKNQVECRAIEKEGSLKFGGRSKGEEKNKNFLGFRATISHKEAGSVRDGAPWRRNVSSSRGKQQIFPYSRGNSIIPLPLSLSLRFFDKGSTFKLQAHEARIKFVSRSSLPTSRVEISNKFDRCKSLLIIHTKRSSHAHLSVSSSRDGFETFAINCKQFFLFSLSLSRSTIKRPTPRIQESKSIPR